MNAIHSVTNAAHIANRPAQQPDTAPAKESGGPSFGRLVTESINQLNALQTSANEQVQQLVSGESVELHNVLIAVEEAALSLQLAMQVRNKLVEAYQEISRMQV